MMPTLEQSTKLDEVLNQNRRSGMCHTCGNVQTHSLRWCKCCGGEFCNHTHTLLEAMAIAKGITFEGGKHTNYLKPHYVAAVYWLYNAKPLGLSMGEFEQYIEAQLSTLGNPD